MGHCCGLSRLEPWTTQDTAHRICTSIQQASSHGWSCLRGRQLRSKITRGRKSGRRKAWRGGTYSGRKYGYGRPNRKKAVALDFAAKLGQHHPGLSQYRITIASTTMSKRCFQRRCTITRYFMPRPVHKLASNHLCPLSKYQVTF